MNYSRTSPFQKIPPGIYENIIRPAIADEGISTEEIGQDNYENNTILQIIKRLDALDAKIADLESQKTPAATEFATPHKTEKQKTAPLDLDLPTFVSEEFKKDFEQRPAESMLHLIADIYNGNPNVMNHSGNPLQNAMELLSNLSRQVRKDRLSEKYDDAIDLMEQIEALFRDIPEIEKRPDAYEIAYKMVKAQLIPQEMQAKKVENNSKLLADKGRAFVEDKKGSSPLKDANELTPQQKEICKKLGISEKTFRKYILK